MTFLLIASLILIFIQGSDSWTLPSIYYSKRIRSKTQIFHTSDNPKFKKKLPATELINRRKSPALWRYDLSDPEEDETSPIFYPKSPPEDVYLDNAKLMRVPDHFIPMQYTYKKANMYVRDCYPQYFDILWKDLFVDDMDSVLITGSPGIGKSIFYIYVLERIKQQSEIKDIVLASFNKESDLRSCVILKQGGVVLKREKSIPVIDNALYLYDGIPRIVEEGAGIKTVIFASPNHKFIKEHSKNPTMKKRFMPLWSEHEIVEAVDYGIGL